MSESERNSPTLSLTPSHSHCLFPSLSVSASFLRALTGRRDNGMPTFSLPHTSSLSHGSERESECDWVREQYLPLPLSPSTRSTSLSFFLSNKVSYNCLIYYLNKYFFFLSFSLYFSLVSHALHKAQISRYLLRIMAELQLYFMKPKCTLTIILKMLK